MITKTLFSAKNNDRIDITFGKKTIGLMINKKKYVLNKNELLSAFFENNNGAIEWLLQKISE